MSYIFAICAVAAAVLGTLMYRDPDSFVRVWATVGFSVAVVSAYVSVVSLGTFKND